MKSNVIICGISFCGSTVMNLVLGSLPDAAAIGESHWIVDRLIDQKRNRLRYCRLCDKYCDILTTEFRDEMRVSENWYSDIAKKLKTDVLVSSDKNPNYLKRFDGYMDSKLIVLFKNPLFSWESFWKRRNLEIGNLRHRQIGVFLEHYCENYDFFLDLKKGGKHDNILFLEWDTFLMSPTSVLKKLCQKLELQYSSDALEYWNKRHHYIGGNFSIYSRLNGKGAGSLALRTPHLLREPKIKKSDKQMILEHKIVEAYHRMKEEEAKWLLRE